jgi:hypothetical protein
MNIKLPEIEIEIEIEKITDSKTAEQVIQILNILEESLKKIDDCYPAGVSGRHLILLANCA